MIFVGAMKMGIDWDETVETDSSGMVVSTNYRTLEELYQAFKERLQEELIESKRCSL